MLLLRPDEIRAALHRGATVAEVARANGVDTDAVIASLVHEFESRISPAVLDGRLTHADARALTASVANGFAVLANGVVTSRQARAKTTRNSISP